MNSENPYHFLCSRHLFLTISPAYVEFGHCRIPKLDDQPEFSCNQSECEHECSYPSFFRYSRGLN